MVKSTVISRSSSEIPKLTRFAKSYGCTSIEYSALLQSKSSNRASVKAMIESISKTLSLIIVGDIAHFYTEALKRIVKMSKRNFIFDYSK